MFSKRPDKHTTGLINLRNDCFANASVQAYSSLPGLTDYLNTFLRSYDNLFKVEKKYNLSLDSVITTEEIRSVLSSKGSRQRFDMGKEDAPIRDQFSITLHIALAKITKKLQDTQMCTRTVSVWTFLHELERIYNAKISRSQHDAHELTQLINETLETENLVCSKLSRNLLLELSKFGNKEDLEAIEIPDFPFNGLLLSQMRCLTCSYSSKPSFSPFLMLTLHPPQTTSSDLETLLDENEMEKIAGYHCLKCRITAILHNEKDQQDPESDTDKHLVSLRQLDKNPELFINEDLPPVLENYIKDYKKGELDANSITSTVIRKTQILKPPKVFGIHLSRSAFNGISVTRNPCRVSFNDKLTLSIGNEYVEELRKFNNAISEKKFEPRQSNILTTDSDDMEDESVQQEDIDEHGFETDTQEDDSDTDGATDSPSTSDSSSVSTEGTDFPSMETDNTSKGLSEGRLEVLNNKTMTGSHSASLKGHFRRFQFDDENVYKYRLRAMIKHQGSHTQGHYECYKRKPLFARDGAGNILKISPEIDEDALKQAQSFKSNSANMANEETNHERAGAFTESTGAFRNKFSSLIGRRPSISQTDPKCANLQEIADSGLATPAEVLVDQGDYFSGASVAELDEQLSKVKLSNDSMNNSKMKMKKIPSLIKHPFWKVGDSQVAEVSKSSVLLETASVYMLYYERADRKQIEV
ncbi:uncharacterized protein CXQ87_002389 [Candidozyma duobushaemuli]|nr:uncharacterized protein CXQ87_002389 [[Candida] duobushaemulonis]PVH14261.1 hypothetical protein CXQ87_002389 [[Candida] duobushaemulonis]